jgi:hypothetical protein
VIALRTISPKCIPSFWPKNFWLVLASPHHGPIQQKPSKSKAPLLSLSYFFILSDAQFAAQNDK